MAPRAWFEQTHPRSKRGLLPLEYRGIYNNLKFLEFIWLDSNYFYYCVILYSTKTSNYIISGCPRSVKITIYWRYLVEPQGVEPQPQDFQSCAPTAYAKVPFLEVYLWIEHSHKSFADFCLPIWLIHQVWLLLLCNFI